MRRLLLVLLTLILVWVPFSTHLLQTALANSTKENQVHFLVIYAETPPQNLSFNSNDSYEITYEAMSMKRFVADRADLNGKYDGIIISEGNYSTEGVKVNSKDHATQRLMNDITNNKADQIIKHYVQKNQPVFIHADSIANGGKLQAKLSNLAGNSVKYYRGGQNQLLQTVAAYMNTAFIKKPSFNVTQKPEGVSKKVYRKNEEISYSINIHNTNVSGMKLRLYIDQNFNDRFESGEVVKEVNVTNHQQTLTFKLPHGFSGPRTWKLELVQPRGQFAVSDYETGSFLFEDKEIEINVLQVHPSNSSASSLKKSQNMKQSYLERDGQYKININVTKFDVFNSSPGSGGDSGKYSHSLINGKYDMIIFGFGDSYNSNTNLSAGAIKSVENFIESGQSVMFTHDTIFQTNNDWVKHFMDETGQIAPHTNMGYGAPNRSTQTKKVNEGMMTSFPYDLPENVSIASTHNQYYTLDLEDENLIPWYNITGSNRDVNDSWNHYYTYSKGNVTYSGTGHTSTGFPDGEQRLFVNTMYRAFTGANQAPEINVESPDDAEEFPLNQTIPISFTVTDDHLSSKRNKVKVYLNNQVVFEKNDVRNNEFISFQAEHGMESEGEVDIRIVAQDEKGAETVKTRTVTLFELPDNLLELSRKLDPVKQVYEVERDLIKVNYTIDLKPIERNEIGGQKSFWIENVQYEEVFPPNVEIMDLPSFLTKKGTLESGYTVTGLIEERIDYTKDYDDWKGKWRGADPVSFSIGIKVTEGGKYLSLIHI